jgi:VCBS repeat-containing protein
VPPDQPRRSPIPIAGPVALCALGALAVAPSGPARAQSPFPPAFELAGLAAGDGGNGFVLNGIAGGDDSGYSVAGAGDVNGDGVDDLIIGARFADPNGKSRAGESYVVFGRSGGFSASLDLSALDGTNGFVLNGIDGVDASGISVAGAGDVNGDGVDDLIIGAPGADPNGDSRAGESYVVFGQSTGFSASLDLSVLDGTNGFILNGITDGDDSGFSVAGAGDVNGDGVDDLIIAAYNADPNGNTGAGASYVVFGRSDGFSASLELSALDGTNGFVLNGIDAVDASGRSVAGAGDVNGDGVDDLIIGADGADPNGDFSGESYVVFGQSEEFSGSLELSALDGDNGFVLNGIDRFDASGRSVAGAGDVNGDGVDDLIIGAPLASSNGNDSGASYVVFGTSDGFPASLDLSALDGTNGFVLNGIDGDDDSGTSVAGAGDVNGDDIDDLIIGADGADPNGLSSGESYVVFGQSDGFDPSLNLSTLDGTNGFVLNGIDEDDFSGESLAGAGDVNGDGVDDLIIGAPGANSSGSQSGESYVVFGRSTAPSNQPPVAQDDALTTDEATPISANLFGDNGAGPDTDPEGETLTVDAVNGNSAAVNTTLSLDSGALLTVSGEGTLDYDPNGAFDALGAGETAEETFTYRVTDGTRAAEANVTLTIAGLDDDGAGDGTGDGAETGDSSQDDDGGGGIGLAGVLGAMLALLARRRSRPSRGSAGLSALVR